ncbi:hypothetical protein DMX05_23460 [Pseudomonas soli]|uniref:Uncharacterized protein n=1 Tax=Pseudomonas soli TaxID=1306993 RepID=A0AAJ5MJ49_9PSED|nr:hypothetical protein [Pseudomonas soli]PYC33656.1 hypothetical protein DMX05_23460 [Pseudomonas soli]UXZ44113.1 hypothetical protein K7K07_18825 [Pseudomonas soli]
MSESKVSVALLAIKREAQEAQETILELVHTDMTESPELLQPIPASLLSRMADLRARAQANRKRTVLFEG